MRILSKEISIFDFLPYMCLRLWRQYLVSPPEWRKWQNPAVPVLLYHGPELNSYSQFGEDIILADLFRDKRNGKFLDVGANHPTELNNTYRLYQQGWRGVNIEPGIKMHNLLNEVRPDDKNLRIGLGKTAGHATFYEMDVDSVSTFNKDVAGNSQYYKRIVSQNDVQIQTLADVFASEFSDVTCDLLSIDVEGDNSEVLEGNDWQRFRPSIIIIEMPGEERLDIVPYLYQQGYFLIFDNSLNGVFKDSGVPGPHPYPADLAQCLTSHQAA